MFPGKSMIKKENLNFNSAKIISTFGNCWLMNKVVFIKLAGRDLD